MNFLLNISKNYFQLNGHFYSPNGQTSNLSTICDDLKLSVMNQHQESFQKMNFDY